LTTEQKVNAQQIQQDLLLLNARYQALQIGITDIAKQTDQIVQNLLTENVALKQELQKIKQPKQKGSGDQKPVNPT
jgi:hypothetical protein